MPKSPTAKPDPLDEVEASAVGDMLGALGIDPESVDAKRFQAAMKDFVTACMQREEAGEYE